MKKTISILRLLIFTILLILLTISMCSCGDKNQDNDESRHPANIDASTEKNKADDYNADEKKDGVHYLIFKIDGKEVAKLATSEDDTYENLKLFFPTIPDTYEGYVWEKLDAVYLADEKRVVINAILDESYETDNTEPDYASSETEH